MFADDIPGLQKLLRKKYDACLPPAQMPCFARVPSTGEEIQGLIDGIEAAFFPSPAPDALQVDAQAIGSHLRSMISPVCRRSRDDLLAASRGRLLLDSEGSSAGPRRLDMEEGFLDAIREQVEAISKCLPLRLIPTDCLLERMQLSRSRELGEDTRLDLMAAPLSQARHAESPLLHAVMIECQVLNHLLETVHESLRQIDMALLRNSPLGGSKAHARTCAESLIAGRVPAGWTSSSFPTTKPLAAWLCDISENRLPQVCLVPTTANVAAECVPRQLCFPEALLNSSIQALSWATQTCIPTSGCVNLASLCRPQVHRSVSALYDHIYRNRIDLHLIATGLLGIPAVVSVQGRGFWRKCEQPWSSTS